MDELNRDGLIIGLGALILGVLLCLFSPTLPEARWLAPRAEVEMPGVRLKDGRALVDVNRADQALLATLPGIGKRLAERITADRAQNGPFESTEDLTRVPGIGAGKLRAIEEKIVV